MDYFRVREYLNYEVQRLYGLSVVQWCELSGKDRLMIIKMVNEIKMEGRDSEELEDFIVFDTCDHGHRFAKMPDHPKRDGIARCPHCLVNGIESARESLAVQVSLNVETKKNLDLEIEHNKRLSQSNDAFIKLRMRISRRLEAEKNAMKCEHPRSVTTLFGAVTNQDWTCPDCNVPVGPVPEGKEPKVFERIAMVSTAKTNPRGLLMKYSDMLKYIESLLSNSEPADGSS